VIQVLISENQPGDIDHLAAALAEAPDLQVAGVGRDGLETAQMIAQLRPQVALVRTQLPGMDGVRVCRMAALASPETACLMVADSAEAEENVRVEAMRAGARAITHLDADPSEIIQLVRDLAQASPRRDDEEFRLITDPARMPVTIAVTGAKGGIGKTTLATNLALVLQARFPGQVALIDFVGHYGDCNLLLDLPSNGSMLDLAEYEELDAALVDSRMNRHESGLAVLGGVNGPESMEAPGRINLSDVANLLGVLRREFRVIVIDIPALVHPLSKYVFLRSTFIVVVTSLTDLSTIRDTGSLLSSLIGGQLPADRVKMVVSRYDSSDPFDVEDLEHTTKHAVAVRIPNATDTVRAALNSGMPFVLSRPNAPVSRTVEKLADILVSEMPHQLAKETEVQA